MTFKVKELDIFFVVRMYVVSTFSIYFILYNLRTNLPVSLKSQKKKWGRNRFCLCRKSSIVLHIPTCPNTSYEFVVVTVQVVLREIQHS